MCKALVGMYTQSSLHLWCSCHAKNNLFLTVDAFNLPVATFCTIDLPVTYLQCYILIFNDEAIYYFNLHNLHQFDKLCCGNKQHVTVFLGSWLKKNAFLSFDIYSNPTCSMAWSFYRSQESASAMCMELLTLSFFSSFFLNLGLHKDNHIIVNLYYYSLFSCSAMKLI